MSDWCQGSVACQYEGHDYGDGGICERCGDRLRCHYCNCFIRIDTCERHFMKRHPSTN